MKPLNYCRRLCHWFDLEERSFTIDEKIEVGDVRSAISKATKFLLPDDGRIVDDRDYCAVDRLNMPFQYVVFEFTTEVNQDRGGCVMLVEQVTSDQVRVKTLCFDQHGWIISPYVELHKIERTGEGRLAVHIREVGKEKGKPFSQGVSFIADVVLNFLNAMSCSNVYTEQIKARKKSKHSSNPLPFDDYHYLTISNNYSKRDGSSAEIIGARSPREHLRRGHIRRYSNGEKIWINPCVVNAGNGGVLTKDYRIKTFNKGVSHVSPS